MDASVDEQGLVSYSMRGANVLEELPSWSLSECLGRSLRMTFDGDIHCVATGKKVKKTYGEGLSYEAFVASPLACPSILRPELSRIHEGVALRDEEWEREHHLKPHVVYVSLTSHLKVGVTRSTNVPSRWVDQGAVGALVVAHAPYRQLAGEMEVALKGVLSDKTNWRAMLQHVSMNEGALVEAKKSCLTELGVAYESFFELDDNVTSLRYPVLEYPEKVKSVKLDKKPQIEGTLMGIKGQYWLFDDGRVWNVRSHSGYRIRLEIN
ncbi:MAG: DUF2797 domain-containing protein [Bacteroidetes bacterium]|nr:DUF2797 domain-containing protein [Bacteroidota bacterium]